MKRKTYITLSFSLFMLILAIFISFLMVFSIRSNKEQARWVSFQNEDKIEKRRFEMAMVKQYDNSRELLDKFEKIFIKDEDILIVLDKLEKNAYSSGVLPDIKNINDEDEKITILLEAKGKYDGLKRFLQSLKNIKKVFRVENAHLRRDNNDFWILSVKLSFIKIQDELWR